MSFLGALYGEYVVSDVIKDLYLLSQLSDEVMSVQERTYVVSVSIENDRNGSVVKSNKTLGLQSLSVMRSWVESTAADLKKLNLTGSWSIHIEGWMKTGKSVQSVLYPIELYICADEVDDTSQDEHQYNSSYFSGLFHRYIMIGEERTNLQIVAKQTFPDEQWKMALGTPAIINGAYCVH